jgi:hypothetical protein
MTFFADECFMYEANALLEAFDRDNQIVPLLDRFEKATPDTVWIPSIAKWPEKPVVICGDGRILKNKAELQTLRAAQLMFVYLAPGWTNTPWPIFAWKIIKVWPTIVDSTARTLRPTVFEVRVATLKVEKRFAL